MRNTNSSSTLEMPIAPRTKLLSIEQLKSEIKEEMFTHMFTSLTRDSLRPRAPKWRELVFYWLTDETIGYTEFIQPIIFGIYKSVKRRIENFIP